MSEENSKDKKPESAHAELIKAFVIGAMLRKFFGDGPLPAKRPEPPKVPGWKKRF